MNTSSSLRVLILLPRQLGDVVLGTPLAEAIKALRPDSYVGWWAHPMAKPILDNNPHIDVTYFWPLPPRLSDHRWRDFLKLYFLFLVSLFQQTKSIRQQKFDVVVDAINYPRSTLHATLSGAPTRISFAAGKGRDRFYTHLVPRTTLDQAYLGHGRLALLAPVFPQAAEANWRQNFRPHIFLQRSHFQAPQQWLREEIGDAPAILVTAGHRRPQRQWPKEKFVQLACLLAQTHGIHTLWTCAPGEENQITPLHHMTQKTLEEHGLPATFSHLTPRFSLLEAGALATLCLGWVGNLSGLTHVSAAVGAKTVSIIGPCRALNWYLPEPSHHQFVQNTQGCHSCTLSRCQLPRRECLDDLPVQWVYEAIVSLLLPKENAPS